MKLEWEKIGDLYFARIDDESGYTIEHDMDTKKDGWRWTFTTALKWLLCDTLKDAKAACQSDFDTRVDSLALANGYVKAEDYNAMKAKVAELTDQLKDATDTLDQIEAESACFDALARSAGYVKLEPGQVVVKRATAEHARRLSDCYHCDDPDCRCGECEADLERALEGRP